MCFRKKGYSQHYSWNVFFTIIFLSGIKEVRTNGLANIVLKHRSFRINFTLYDIFFRAFNRSLANPYVVQQVICVQKEFVNIWSSHIIMLHDLTFNMYLYTCINVLRLRLCEKTYIHNGWCPTCNENEHNWSY